MAENARGIETPTRETTGSGPALVAVCGFPGVGKSTVARTLADWLDAVWIRSDAVRKELFEEPTYADEESRVVYEEVMDRAREQLADRPVVIDASFADRRYRAGVQRVAADCGVPFTLVKVDCEESTTVERIEDREDISDADVEVYYAVREAFDPLEVDHVTVDNSESWEATRDQLAAISFRE